MSWLGWKMSSKELHVLHAFLGRTSFSRKRRSFIAYLEHLRSGCQLCPERSQPLQLSKQVTITNAAFSPFVPSAQTSSPCLTRVQDQMGQPTCFSFLLLLDKLGDLDFFVLKLVFTLYKIDSASGPAAHSLQLDLPMEEGICLHCGLVFGFPESPVDSCTSL